MTRLFAIAFGAIIVMMLIASAVMPAADKPPAPASAPVAKASAAATSSALVLQRDGSGQFHLTAMVDGQDTRFLVDTGADIVALSEAEADRLGLMIDPAEFQPMMRTASGVGYGAPVQLASLELAGREFTDVPAVVVQGLEVNLLGQSVLRQLGKVELTGDRMTIRTH
jgi:aspartyl protease family protein